MAAVAVLAGCAPSPGTASNSKVIRVGYFPNITHTQPQVGIANGVFAEELGPNVTLETKTFNAGPSAVEALFAGEIDLRAVGKPIEVVRDTVDEATKELAAELILEDQRGDRTLTPGRIARIPSCWVNGRRGRPSRSNGLEEQLVICRACHARSLTRGRDT